MSQNRMAAIAFLWPLILLLLLLLADKAFAWGEVTTGYGPYHEQTPYSHFDLTTGKVTLGTIRRQGNRVEIDRLNADGYQVDTLRSGPSGIDHTTWGIYRD